MLRGWYFWQILWQHLIAIYFTYIDNIAFRAQEEKFKNLERA
jgi:hypothetical protein